MAHISCDLLGNYSTANKYICRYLEIDQHCSRAKQLREVINLKLKEKIICFKKNNENNHDLQRYWERYNKVYEAAVPNTKNQVFWPPEPSVNVDMDTDATTCRSDQTREKNDKSELLETSENDQKSNPLESVDINKVDESRKLFKIAPKPTTHEDFAKEKTDKKPISENISDNILYKTVLHIKEPTDQKTQKHLNCGHEKIDSDPINICCSYTASYRTSPINPPKISSNDQKLPESSNKTSYSESSDGYADSQRNQKDMDGAESKFEKPLNFKNQNSKSLRNTTAGIAQTKTPVTKTATVHRGNERNKHGLSHSNKSKADARSKKSSTEMRSSTALNYESQKDDRNKCKPQTKYSKKGWCTVI